MTVMRSILLLSALLVGGYAILPAWDVHAASSVLGPLLPDGCALVQSGVIQSLMMYGPNPVRLFLKSMFHDVGGILTVSRFSTLPDLPDWIRLHQVVRQHPNGTPIPVLVQSVYKTFPGPTRKEFRKLFGKIRTPLHDFAMPDDFMQLAVLGRICLGAGSLADLGISNASSYTRDDYDRICRATMHPSALTSDIMYLCLFGESRYPPAQTWRSSIPRADRSGTYSDCVETAALNLLTAILYDVNTTTISRLHRLRSPELIAFYHRFQTPLALATERSHIEFAQVIRERCRQVVAFVHPGSASEVKSGRANFANLVHCLTGIEFDTLLADFDVCRDQDTFTLPDGTEMVVEHADRHTALRYVTIGETLVKDGGPVSNLTNPALWFGVCDSEVHPVFQHGEYALVAGYESAWMPSRVHPNDVWVWNFARLTERSADVVSDMFLRVSSNEAFARLQRVFRDHIGTDVWKSIMLARYIAAALWSRDQYQERVGRLHALLTSGIETAAELPIRIASYLLPHGHDDILSVLSDLRGVYHTGLPRLMAVSALANALRDAADLPRIMSVVLDMFEIRVADLANLDMSPDSDDYAVLRLHAHLRYSNTTSDQVLAILRDPNTNSTDGLDRFAIDVFRRSLNETVAHLANLCDRSMRFCPAGLSVLEAMGRVEYRDWVTLDVFEDIIRAATKYSMLLPGNIFDLFADHLSFDGVDAFVFFIHNTIDIDNKAVRVDGVDAVDAFMQIVHIIERIRRRLTSPDAQLGVVGLPPDSDYRGFRMCSTIRFVMISLMTPDEFDSLPISDDWVRGHASTVAKLSALYGPEFAANVTNRVTSLLK